MRLRVIGLQRDYGFEGRDGGFRVCALVQYARAMFQRRDIAWIHGEYGVYLPERLLGSPDPAQLPSGLEPRHLLVRAIDRPAQGTRSPFANADRVARARARVTSAIRTPN